MDYDFDDGDLHICGYCKQSFDRLKSWVDHKKSQLCKSQANTSHTRLSPHHHHQTHRPSTTSHTSQAQDMTLSTRDVSSSPTDDGSEFSLVKSATSPTNMPIKRSLYPIMPPNRKKVRSRKQESPQPLGKMNESPSSIGSPEFHSQSSSPSAEGIAQELLENPLVKRPRGRPRNNSIPAAVISPQNSTPPVSTSSSHLTSSSAPPTAATLASTDHHSAAVGGNDVVVPHTRRPLVLPRVYSCPRCLKSFIKLSHLHRHMNKKKPCEAKDNPDSQDDNSDSEELLALSSSASLTFTCGLCSEQYQTYDEVVNHHSEKHPAYYPGYCRFCGKFQDRKNKLLIHLAKHDQPEIVNEVAQEVKRIRHIKIEKQLPAANSSNLPGLSSTAGGSGLLSPPSQANADVVCPTCKSKFSDSDELLSHFRDFHAPIGCHISDGDLPDQSFSESTKSAQANASESSLKCFICCLKFPGKESFEQHIGYHQVWSERVTPMLDNQTEQDATNRQVDKLSSSDNSSVSNNNSISKPPPSALKCEETNNNKYDGGKMEDDVIHDADDDSDAMDLTVKKSQCLTSHTSSLNESNGSSPEAETELLDYPCWLCPSQHSDLNSWREHISTVHQLPLVYRCVVEDCRREYTNWNDLYEHRTEHLQRSYVCRICNDHQPTRALLANHSLTHMNSRRLPAACTYCNSLVQENIELHRIKCSQQFVSCNECGDKVKRAGLSKHMLNHSAATGKMYKCDYCDSTFPLKDRLNQHVKNVHGPRKYVCTDCGAAFKRNDKLQRHCQSRHSDLKPYLCPIVSCGRAFKRIDGLRAHVRCSHVTDHLAHSISNNYGCTVCGQLVPGQEKLVDHLMSHVKASPPSVMSASLSGELFGSSGEKSIDGPASVLSNQQRFECPHCHVRVPTETLFYAHLLQHSQLAAALQSQPLTFPPHPFFFGLGQSSTTSSSKND